jgi:hypothetical protein
MKNSSHRPTNKTMINNAQNEIQTRNKDAEKIEDPRLLWNGRKDTQKGRSATKTSTLMQSRLWQKWQTLTFLCGFFCIGRRQKRIYGDEIMDAHRVNAGIWYQDDKGWPDLLSERRRWWWWGEYKLHEADKLSTAVPLLLDTIDLNQMIFATPHTCARDPGSRIVCNLPIPSGTTDNT